MNGQQQGLGAPATQSPPNPYYQPNQGLQAAQAAKAQAEAGKMQAEQAVMEQAAAQQVPQEVQLAEGIMSGQVSQEQLAAAVQGGQIDPNMANAAMGIAQQQMTTPQGLGNYN